MDELQAWQIITLTIAMGILAGWLMSVPFLVALLMYQDKLRGFK